MVRRLHPHRSGIHTHLCLRWDIVVHLVCVDVCCQGQDRGVWLLSLIEVLEVPPELFHIRTGGVGRPRGRVLIPTFQNAEHSAESAPAVEGSKHPPISIADSSARLREYSIRDRLTDIVIPLSMLRMW